MTTRVYAFAFSAEPHRGSEPGVGYEFARALAQLSIDPEFDVRFYTRGHRLAMVREALAEHVPGHRLHVVPIRLWAPIARRLQGPWVRLSYLWWQTKAVSAVVADIAKAPAGDRIVAHHITFATVAVPTFEWRIAAESAREVRHVFGPAGSARMELPVRPTKRDRLAHAARAVVARKNLTHVDLAVSQTTDLVPVLSQLGASEAVVAPNCVVDLPPEVAGIDRDPELIVSVGFLIARKRPWLALETLARLPGRELQLVFVGDGPELGRLRKLAATLGVADRVEFVGQVSRAEALKHIAAASVLLHTSVNEGATWVVAEAQSLGTVPVAPPKTGADSTIGLAGIGVVAASDSPQDLADAVAKALDMQHVSTSMWSRERLPGLLREWYRIPS